MLHTAIYEKLKSVAKAEKTIPYSDVAPLANLDMSNPDHRNQLAQILFEISTYEHQQGRPMLSAVVVHKENNMRGHGFFTLGKQIGKYKDQDDIGFFAEELKSVHLFWSKQAGATK